MITQAHDATTKPPKAKRIVSFQALFWLESDQIFVLYAQIIMNTTATVPANHMRKSVPEFKILGISDR